MTKTGNSYALRVPKRYIDDNHLKLGDVVNIEEPLHKQTRALSALVERGKKLGRLGTIADPVAWQRKQRRSDDPWEKMGHGSA